MKRLLVMDVEGTIFEHGHPLPDSHYRPSLWGQLAAALGDSAVAEEVASQRRHAEGGYASYLEWMEATAQIHRRHGLDSATFQRTIGSANYAPGVCEFMKELDRARFTPMLVTGGFSELARRAQVDFGIRHAFASATYHFNPDGQLAGWNMIPFDFAAKRHAIDMMVAAFGLPSDGWVFIADGKNDVETARNAPLSIAVNADPELQRVATHSVPDFTHVAKCLA